MDLTKSSKKIIISVVAIISAIIMMILIINLTAPTRAANQMQRAIKSKDGIQVINVYNEYCGNANEHSYKEYTAIYDTLFEFIQTVYDDINNQQPYENQIEFENYLSEKYGTIVISNDGQNIIRYCEDNYEFSSLVSNIGLYDLYASRNEYIQGCENLANLDYEGAIYHFEQVIDNDNAKNRANSKITECQNKIVEQKIAIINSYIEKGELDKAEEYLQSIENNISSNQANAFNTKIRKARLSIIDKYCANEKFEDAENYIKTLDFSIQNEANVRLKTGKVNKAKEYLEKAENAFKEKNRDQIDKMASKALELGASNKDVKKKAEYYKSFAQFKMYKSNNCISYTNKFCYWYGFNSNITANDSSEMSNCISLVYSLYSSGLQASATYNLAGEYNKVSGKYFVTYDYRVYKQSGYFEIYGDGKKLYTSKKLKIDTLPQEFSIDVTNIKTLEIKMYGRDYGDTGAYGISNFVATKNFPK